MKKFLTKFKTWVILPYLRYRIKFYFWRLYQIDPRQALIKLRRFRLSMNDPGWERLPGFRAGMIHVIESHRQLLEKKAKDKYG